jgi:glucan phosphoethanolaminetransferase (alkaline phosphatase superfamily)
MFEKILNHFILTAPFMLPLLGAMHIFVYSILERKVKTSLAAGLLIVFLIIIFKPLMSLLPGLGIDSFSESTNFDIKEAFFYIKTFGYSTFSMNSMIFWSVAFSLYGISIWLMQKILVKLGYRRKIIVRFTALIIAVLIVPSIFFKAYTLVSAYQKASSIQSIVKENFDSNLISVGVEVNNDIPLNIIVYIGESTSRLHWSLYGYPRPTTASLDTYKKREGLIKFENIHSPHTHTSPSLLEVLSISTEDSGSFVSPQPIELRKRTSVVDVFRKGGIETHLYSNQGTSGTWNMASSIIFKNAYVKKYSSTKILGNFDYIDNQKPFDHILLDYFLSHVKVIPKEQKSLSVFHSYAGHGSYAQNIPIDYREVIDDYYHETSNAALFGKAKNIATIENIEDYDSAMRYISDNLVQVFNKVDAIDKPTVVIYFSDHGESPLSGRGHDSSRYVWEMSAVPFLMYFNEPAKIALEAKYMTYKARSEVGNDDSLVNLSSLLFDLFGVKITTKIDLKNPLNYCNFGTGNCYPNYHIIRELLDGKISYVSLGDVKSDEDSIDKTDRSTAHANLARRLLSDNQDLVVCTHRNNSLASIIRSRAINDCLEMDVGVEDASVNIFHPPAKNTGLTLSKALRAIGDRNTIVWLDSKNIDKEKNCSVLADEIIDDKNNNISYFVEFPSDSINNLTELSSCMSKLKRHGAYLSYYIPTRLGIKCAASEAGNSPKSPACNKLKKILESVSESKVFSDISYDYTIAPVIDSINSSSVLTHNVWHISDDEVKNLSKGKYRLILPYNDDPNVQ